ncbi:hypothetical protein COCON_G00101180 [Conger conger]|uniref:Kazal-like domain-containing protein n=1 Tax=Conger conger TaxID=82655 RepID=A0A9Q1HZ16_CONCO|nr:hypothetical protein COCON_G00101180 [Conger conger]
MAIKVLLLGLLLIFAVDAEEKSGLQPSCGEMSHQACPLNLAPVCGTDGITYPNECTLCFERQRTKANILIMKYDDC